MPKGPRALPIKWIAGKHERPDWEHASELLELDAIEDSESARERFDKLPHHDRTKVGGWPTGIQSVADNADDYVLQIGSEDKAHWMWGHGGITTFGRAADGRWSFACQTF